MSGTSPRPGEREGRRTHPLTGLVQGGIVTGGAVLAIGGSWVQGDRWGGVPWPVALAFAVVGGLVVGQAVGFAGWWFTRYVIDDEELRIDSGVLTKRSRRIPFERLQSVDVTEPALARLAGLAELRITMAGGSQTGTSLRFLTRPDAERLRALLLRLAHGPDDRVEEASVEPPDELITRVPPARAALGVALSLDFLGAVGALLVLLLAAVGLGRPLVLLGGAVPVGLWAVRIVSARVVQQWGFALYRTPRGLRIERGLLTRTSQTIPFARVQGVRCNEPLLWRLLGWQSLDVDVAGHAGQGDDDADDASSILLPIADPALAAAVAAEVLPHGRAPETVRTVRAAARSRLFAPIGWRYRRLSLEAATARSTTGWLLRTTSEIGYDKAQSVAIEQGPLQRRLGVASVHVHTPEGPVDVDVHHVRVEDALAVAAETVARARRARAR